MPDLDPMLVCIVAAVLVLIAHGSFALAKRRSGDGEPGAVAEGVATLLCGLALIGPLAVLPFASDVSEGVILLGTIFAVIASSLPIVVLRRRVKGTAPEPFIVNRRVVARQVVRAPRAKVRVVVPPGTDPAEAVRSAITGPIPRIVLPPAVRPHPEAATVSGPRQWTPPAPVAPPQPMPEAAPETAPDPAPEAVAEPPLPAVFREAEKVTKALDEVDSTVDEVKTWLRLDG